jgi:hypothetical protein
MIGSLPGSRKFTADFYPYLVSPCWDHLRHIREAQGDTIQLHGLPTTDARAIALRIF